MSISKLTSKVVDDKRRYREYKARTARLPATIARRSTRWSGT